MTLIRGKPMGIEIGRARRDDAESICSMWISFLEEMSSAQPDIAPSDDARKRLDADIGSWLSDPGRHLYVARTSGKVVGFVHAEAWRLPPIYVGRDEVFVNELFVLPEFRRQGIGRSLLASVVDLGQKLGAEGLRASIVTANDQSVAFWQACGAKPLVSHYSMEIEHKEPPSSKTSKRIGF